MLKKAFNNLYTKWGITIIVSASIHIALFILLLIVASAYLIRNPELIKQIYVQVISSDQNPTKAKQKFKFRPMKISTNLLPAVPSYSGLLPKLQTTPKSNSLIGGTNLVGIRSDIVLPYGEGLLKNIDDLPKIDALSNVLYEKTKKSTPFETKIDEVAKTSVLSAPPPKVDRNASQLYGLAFQPSQPPLEVEIKTPLERISNRIIKMSDAKKVDLVFILDISESMSDNIKSTTTQLKEMVETLSKGNIDFTLGLVMFHDGFGYQLLGWDVMISPQTTDVKKIIESLESIRCRGDERALDALTQAASKVKFRPEAQKRFILITDEYVKGSHSGVEVLNRIKSLGITVDVIGIDEPFQKALAEQTGGNWTPIGNN